MWYQGPPGYAGRAMQPPTLGKFGWRPGQVSRGLSVTEWSAGGVCLAPYSAGNVPIPPILGDLIERDRRRVVEDATRRAATSPG